MFETKQFNRLLFNQVLVWVEGETCLYLKCFSFFDVHQNSDVSLILTILEFQISVASQICTGKHTIVVQIDKNFFILRVLAHSNFEQDNFFKS